MGKGGPTAMVIPKKDVSIETEICRALLTSEGAGLKEFKFKKCRDREEA